MSNVYNDEVGRCFCAAHRKDHCNICCMSFRESNVFIEIQAGLRKGPDRTEELAKEKVTIERGLKYMYQQDPQTRHGMQGNIDFHKTELERVERELAELRSQGKAKEIAKSVIAETEKAVGMDTNNRALVAAMARANPGQREFRVGGEDSQKLYDQYVAEPPSSQRDKALDPYICSYCQKISTDKLFACARCKKQAYCDRNCQKDHWKAHKKQCVSVDALAPEEEKKMPLTWKQLEQFKTANGEKFEARFIEQESGLRMIALCKDRVGLIKRVAAYTNSRSIPGFAPGKIMVWKNPRFHYFADGSSGARIEESDLANITIKG